MIAPKESAQSQPGSSGLQNWMRQRPLFSFFLLAYGFSWILFIPYVLAEQGILRGNYVFMYILHTFGPTFAALIMTVVIRGKAGLQDLRQRIRQWRAPWQWYLFILFGIPALILIGIIIQPGTSAAFHDLTPLLLVSYPFAFIATFFGGGSLGEEIGWRGFALPRACQCQYFGSPFDPPLSYFGPDQPAPGAPDRFRGDRPSDPWLDARPARLSIRLAATFALGARYEIKSDFGRNDPGHNCCDRPLFHFREFYLVWNHVSTQQKLDLGLGGALDGRYLGNVLLIAFITCPLDQCQTPPAAGEFLLPSG